MKKLISLLIFSGLLGIGCKSPADYVNPLVGTDGHGHTYPGAIVPFGGVQVSPDTRLSGWDGCSGYHYSDSLIYGFSHTHLSGTGCSDYGDVLVMPFNGNPSLQNQQYASTFSHRNEKAEAGYYAVKLDNKVKVELTAGAHVAVHQYTFPHKKGAKGIIIDLTHRDKVLSSGMMFKDNEILGWRESEAWNTDQYCAFSMLASEPITKIEFYQDDKRINADQVRGTNCKALVYFAENTRKVVLHVAISGTDMAGAHLNQSEIPEFDFKKSREQAFINWNNELGKIEIENKDKEPVKVFYTALYHCFTSPYLYNDIDGRYRGMDKKIHQTEDGHQMYTVFSLWDTYRALHPLLNIIDQKRTSDFLYTFLKDYEQGSTLPMWELSGGETWCMIGYHSVPVIYDAYVKGLSNYNKQEMLAAMIHSATLDKLGRLSYAQKGYLSSEEDNESVSKTLEYAYDDWCISMFAKSLGNDSVYNIFMQRAQSYKNILDPQGFMHGKFNGGWIQPFNPTEVNNCYTEANSWQYSTYVPQDIENYISMMGGREVFENFLDSLFHTQAKLSGRNQSDIAGMIGQYAHGNEPSHHASYLYDYIGVPHKTQELTRKIMTELYTNEPDGLCGNEDCGQMSAWYVMSAMGFYPVCPGTNQYAIGFPMFDKVTIHLENGNKFVIKKDNQKPYIQSAKLNGMNFANAYLTYDQLTTGGELSFMMGDKPSSTWGKAISQQPSTKIDKQITTVPYFSTDKVSFANLDTVSILLYDPIAGASPEWKALLSQTKIYYTLDGSIPTPEHGKLYTEPLVFNRDMVLKAIAWNPVTGSSKVVEANYIHYVKDKDITYITTPDPQYYAGGAEGLIDHIRGRVNYRIGNWQGFQGNLETVIDLRQNKTIREIGVGCLEDTQSWIFYPRKVQVSVSSDNVHFTPFGEIVSVSAVEEMPASMHDFVIKGNANARYVKLTVVNFGKLPAWHISGGEQAWLFVDEILIK